MVSCFVGIIAIQFSRGSCGRGSFRAPRRMPKAATPRHGISDLLHPAMQSRGERHTAFFEYGFMRSCYYTILGVSVRATQEEIKRAFRMLALRWHPDCNPQDPLAAERFMEVLDAYENLIDPSKRGRYDKGRRYVKPRAKTRSCNRRPI